MTSTGNTYEPKKIQSSLITNPNLTMTNRCTLIKLAQPMNLVAYSGFPPHMLSMGKYQKSSISRSNTLPCDAKHDITNSSNISSSGRSYSNHAGLNGEQLSKTNLYIRGLRPDMNDKDLVALCQPYGKIISTKAIIDQSTGKCKGYGFVDYDNEKAAETAVKALQSNGIQAQMAKQQEQDSTNLYIANLPENFSEADLEQLFVSSGGIVSTRILRDQSGKSRGVGFARMESKECCEKAIQNFNGKILTGHKDPLTVKFADGGSKRRLHHYQSNKQWTDHQEATVPNTFEHITGVAGMAPTGLAQFTTVPRFVASPAFGGIPIHPQTGWVGPCHQGFIMQAPFATMLPGGIHTAAPSIDPSLLATQMGNLHLGPAPAFLPATAAVQPNTYMHFAYPTAQPLQPMTIEDMTCDPAYPPPGAYHPQPPLPVQMLSK